MQYSVPTKSNKWNQTTKKIFSRAKIHKFSKIYTFYILYTHVCVCVCVHIYTQRSFSTTHDEGQKRTSRGKERCRNWRTSTNSHGGSEYQLEKLKQTRCKQKVITEFSCFKIFLLSRNLSGSLTKKRKTQACVFFKKFQDNSDMPVDFQKQLEVFLFHSSFGDIESYCFPADQSKTFSVCSGTFHSN